MRPVALLLCAVAAAARVQIGAPAIPVAKATADFDVVVYGATPGGIQAALAAANEGVRVQHRLHGGARKGRGRSSSQRIHRWAHARARREQSRVLCALRGRVGALPHYVALGRRAISDPSFSFSRKFWDGTGTQHARCAVLDTGGSRGWAASGPEWVV